MSRRSLLSALACIAAIAAVVSSAGPFAGGGAGPSPAEGRPTIDDLGFMTGSWRADWRGNQLEEHFAAPRDGSMIGMFRWTADGATSFTEHMVVEQRADGVHFFLRHFNPGGVVWDQEKDGPMAFRLDDVGDGRAVFVDEDRDFPNRIVYHRTEPDVLIVQLDGRGETGEPRQMDFVFRSTSMSTGTESLTEVGQSVGYSGGLTIAFQVKDITKSIDWYQNVLGFKVLYHVEEMGWCELTTSVENVAIGLSQVETVKPGGPTPTFGVKDIEHARKQLEDKGVKFDGDTIEIPDMVKLATFFDPDGNSLMFYQSLSDEMP